MCAATLEELASWIVLVVRLNYKGFFLSHFSSVDSCGL